MLPLPDALDECAREPIHIPGAIQPHGALLAMTLPGFELTHWSANCEAMLGLQPGTFGPRCDLRQVLPRAFLHDLGNTLQAAAIARVPERMADARPTDAGAPVDVIAHVTAGGAVCEFVPVAGADSGRMEAAVLLRAMMSRLSRVTSIDRLLSLATQQVRAVTGYDRVMIYKFRPDQSGIVIAESLRSGLEPYMGLHYPASDIPAQARELYRRQPLRQIPAIDYQPIPILAASGDTPLDLSLASLRSVSPIHLEYLRNMGSAATLTISILRGGVLWGLIACHHERPRKLSSATCAAMELFAQMFSLQLEAREQAVELQELTKAHAVVDALRHASADRPIVEAIDTMRNELLEVLPHDGVATWIDGVVDLSGSTPPAEAIPELARHLSSVVEDGIYASSHLSAELPDALRYTSPASGVLAMSLSRGRKDFLLFFRKEQIQTIVWGGDPNKPVTLPQNGGRIGPRQSFSAWKETVRGASLPWRRAEMQLAELLQLRVLEFLLSHARSVDEGRRAASETQKLLIAELGHRVKNIFALIRSVVRQSRAGADTIETYAGDLERRIAALAIAHDQVTQAGWRPASLRTLLEEQARTWSNGKSDRVLLEGPPVLLDVRALQAFALVLHEMMTNAAKYGALSVPGATIAVSWTLDGDGLAIAWRERGGPPVREPARRGFGTTVISQTIPFELRGTTRVRYAAGGLEADFMIPRECVTQVAQEQAPRPIAAPVFANLAGKRLLLVEDSMMIALDAQAGLEAIGATVEIVSSVADALRAVALGTFTHAVLDINLRGETSIALADALSSRGIPFVFATGYGDQINIPEKFRDVPKVAKPYDAAALAGAIGAVEVTTEMGLAR